MFRDSVADLNTQILDTRKTIPGLRQAQKYAARTGGVLNHRVGLFDAYLIKENHIQAAGSITLAVNKARQQNPRLSLEVEVENLAQLKECVKNGVPRALLDNFSVSALQQATEQFADRIELEASGGINAKSVREIAQTGVHFISIGEITKNVDPMDLSMQFL